MADITINKNETIELDTIIKESSLPLEPVSYDTGGTNLSDKFDLSGIQTNTAILDPKETGTHDININGQILTIKVEETSAIPDSGVARYTLDDADISGSTIIDIWNNNDITSQNSITTGDSGLSNTYDSGQSINLDGVDNYLEGSNGLLDGLSNWSVSLWANFTGSSKGWLVSEKNNNGNFGILNNTIGNELRIYYNTTQIRPSGDLGSAEHITVTFDGSNLIVYRDGTQAGNTSESGSFTSSGFYYGVRSGLVEYHEGGIDDIRLYNKALSPTEVSNLYNTGSISG